MSAGSWLADSRLFAAHAGDDSGALEVDQYLHQKISGGADHGGWFLHFTRRTIRRMPGQLQHRPRRVAGFTESFTALNIDL